MKRAAEIGGWCDPRRAAVRGAFTANFADRGQLYLRLADVSGREADEIRADARAGAATSPWTRRSATA